MQDNGLAQRIKNYFSALGGGYKKVFSYTNPDSRVVLKDLAKFCKANETSFHPDPYVSAAMEGRREVWLRILKHTNLTADELYDIFKGMNKGPDGG